MFWPDVIALKEFYNSALGRITGRHIGTCIRQFWSDTTDCTVLGIGFTLPYLQHFTANNRCTFSLMPAGQGVIHWAPNNLNLSLLADETELPFPDNSIQRVLIVHALENSENTKQLMAEIWRVLAPTGRLLAVVPNRRGIWARSLQSPFAHGQPFTHWQLRQLFAKHSFTPVSIGSALFFPPSNRQYILRSAGFCEQVGRNFFPGFGGVLIMEAEKQIYAPAIQKAMRSPKMTYIPAVQPI
ncbi:MAG TPA: class I SAM-dependent methyltransferase [Rickettsiales bacterium]|nr:class I SAM-dependent methyltransferase [Rickettsiales bacterium]